MYLWKRGIFVVVVEFWEREIFDFIVFWLVIDKICILVV